MAENELSLIRPKIRLDQKYESVLSMLYIDTRQKDTQMLCFAHLINFKWSMRWKWVRKGDVLMLIRLYVCNLKGLLLSWTLLYIVA